MKVFGPGLEGLLVIEPVVYGDERGFFMEAWHAERYREAGLPERFVQSNVSRSAPGVLRGLHYQHPEGQGKLIQVLEGSVFDVAADIRVDSPTFGQWAGVELSADNHRQFYVPPGFAHGFCVLRGPALMSYLVTRPFAARFDAAVAWDDPDIAVDWPIQPGHLSDKDANAPRLADIAPDRLPRMES